MAYTPRQTRLGRGLSILPRLVDLRAYGNEYLTLSQQFSKQPAGKAHQDLWCMRVFTGSSGIKWVVIDSSHLHFYNSTACNESVMLHPGLQGFRQVGVAAGNIEPVSFVAKWQACMQCGRSSLLLTCPPFHLFHILRFHIWLQDWSNWPKQPPAFSILGFFFPPPSPHPCYRRSPAACASA